MAWKSLALQPQKTQNTMAVMASSKPGLKEAFWVSESSNSIIITALFILRWEWFSIGGTGFCFLALGTRMVLLFLSTLWRWGAKEKVMCWGVQIGEGARMQCGAWLLVISKSSLHVQCWPLWTLIKFCFLPKPHHLQLTKQWGVAGERASCRGWWHAGGGNFLQMAFFTSDGSQLSLLFSPMLSSEYAFLLLCRGRIREAEIK